MKEKTKKSIISLLGFLLFIIILSAYLVALIKIGVAEQLAFGLAVILGVVSALVIFFIKKVLAKRKKKQSLN
jgi:membrane protein implicated in regulation of membrane protease activity